MATNFACYFNKVHHMMTVHENTLDNIVYIEVTNSYPLHIIL